MNLEEMIQQQNQQLSELITRMDRIEQEQKQAIEILSAKLYAVDMSLKTGGDYPIALAVQKVREAIKVA